MNFLKSTAASCRQVGCAHKRPVLAKSTFPRSVHFSHFIDRKVHGRKVLKHGAAVIWLSVSWWTLVTLQSVEPLVCGQSQRVQQPIGKRRDLKMNQDKIGQHIGSLHTHLFTICVFDMTVMVPNIRKLKVLCTKEYLFKASRFGLSRVSVHPFDFTKRSSVLC